MGKLNTSYVHTKQLLGRRVDEVGPRDTDPTGGPPWFHAMGLRYDFVPDQHRGTIRLPDGKTDENGVMTTISAEQLVALTLVKCKELSTAHLREHQRGRGVAPQYAITVPVWWTKLQRKALTDAAKLAGMEPVALVNDNVALAYKYALSRNPREIMESKIHKKSKTDVHHALLYDIGATGATASIVRIDTSTKTKGRKMSVVETVNVRAVAWSDVAGGRSFDRKLSALLADRYNAMQAELGSTTDVRDDARAMATLLREAAKTKEKLSANKELAVSIDGLPSSVAEFGDLKTVVTRSELEEVTGDLVEALLAPLRRLLDETGMSKTALDAVTLVGGGSRVPILQEKIKKFLRREQLDLKLSGDEAVVQGLAAYGASQAMGKDFRRDLKVVHQPFPSGTTPSRAQLVEPLLGDALTTAVNEIGKLTEKAAALAAHQQALSDFEALLFRWEERLNPESWEADEDEDESDDSQADGSESDGEAGEGEVATSSWFAGYGGGEEDDDAATELSEDAERDGEDGDEAAEVVESAEVEAEPVAELTEEEKLAAAEATAAAAKAAAEQKVLLADGKEWLAAQREGASTEALLAQLQDLDVSLNALEPEVEEEDYPEEGQYPRHHHNLIPRDFSDLVLCGPRLL